MPLLWREQPSAIRKCGGCRQMKGWSVVRIPLQELRFERCDSRLENAYRQHLNPVCCELGCS